MYTKTTLEKKLKNLADFLEIQAYCLYKLTLSNTLNDGAKNGGVLNGKNDRS